MCWCSMQLSSNCSEERNNPEWVVQHEFDPSMETSVVCMLEQWCINNITPDAGSKNATSTEITAMFLSNFMYESLIVCKNKQCIETETNIGKNLTNKCIGMFTCTVAAWLKSRML